MCVKLNNVRLAGDITKPVTTYSQANAKGESLAIYNAFISVKNSESSIVTIRIRAYGDTAIAMAKSVVEGGFIRIHGQLLHDSYKDQHGTTHYESYIRISEWYPAARGYYENSFQLCGNLSKEITFFPQKEDGSAKAFCRSTIAVNRKGSDEKTDFIDFAAFGNNAEVITKYLTKGRGLYVEGKLTARNWTSKDNKPMVSYEVLVSRWQFADNKGTSSGGSTTPPVSNSNAQQVVNVGVNAGNVSGVSTPSAFDALFTANMG